MNKGLVGTVLLLIVAILAALGGYFYGVDTNRLGRGTAAVYVGGGVCLGTVGSVELPTQAPCPLPTDTPVNCECRAETATLLPQPTATPSPVDTATLLPQPTATSSPVDTATLLPQPTATPSPVDTATPRATLPPPAPTATEEPPPPPPPGTATQPVETQVPTVVGPTETATSVLSM